MFYIYVFAKIRVRVRVKGGSQNASKVKFAQTLRDGRLGGGMTCSLRILSISLILTEIYGSLRNPN